MEESLDRNVPPGVSVRRVEDITEALRIKEIAEARVRYGYRRIHVLLRREGWMVNHKRVCRLYRGQGLQLRKQYAQAAGQGQAPIGPSDRQIGE